MGADRMQDLQDCRRVHCRTLIRATARQSSYVWQLTAVTDLAGDRGYAQAQTRFCKISVIASPAGIVTQLNTEDSNAGTGAVAVAIGMYGSICAQRLGMKPQT
jgi:hypothetical protein